MQNQVKAKILIADDDDIKIQEVRNIWMDILGSDNCEFLEANSIAGAFKILKATPIDLLILDLKIPRRDNSNPDEYEARRFLEELHEDHDIRPPREVIILTAFEDSLENNRSFFEKMGWQILFFDISLDDWKSKLTAKFEYILKCIHASNSDVSAKFNYDYCLISALKQPELDQVLRLPYDWKSTENLDSTEFYTGTCTILGHPKKIVCGSSFQMGMVHASLLCAKAWHYFKPRFIILVGIAAGVRNSTHFGDILIAEEVWDFGAGKVSEDKEKNRFFQPDPRHINADHALTETLLNFGRKNDLCANIEKEWGGELPHSRLKVLKGPVASGSAVIAREAEIKDIISLNRKLIGLEMEAYGMYAACQSLPRPRPRYVCVKSVCDYADGEKNDHFQHYAAFTSAQFIRHAIEQGMFEKC